MLLLCEKFLGWPQLADGCEPRLPPPLTSSKRWSLTTDSTDVLLCVAPPARDRAPRVQRTAHRTTGDGALDAGDEQWSGAAGAVPNRRSGVRSAGCEWKSFGRGQAAEDQLIVVGYAPAKFNSGLGCVRIFSLVQGLTNLLVDAAKFNESATTGGGSPLTPMRSQVRALDRLATEHQSFGFADGAAVAFSFDGVWSR